jgi:hypothetical protein
VCGVHSAVIAVPLEMDEAASFYVWSRKYVGSPCAFSGFPLITPTSWRACACPAFSQAISSRQIYPLSRAALTTAARLYVSGLGLGLASG